MPLSKGTNPNHPKKGESIKAEPIRSMIAIDRIKTLLNEQPRNRALFVVGINTGLTASQLLNLKVKDVINKNVLKIDESNGSKRSVILNKAATGAITCLLRTKKHKNSDYLFCGAKGRLAVQTLNSLVKKWCKQVNLAENYGALSLRKTWGYHQKKTFSVDMPVLSNMFGHQTQKQTFDYLCVQPDTTESVYRNEL